MKDQFKRASATVVVLSVSIVFLLASVYMSCAVSFVSPVSAAEQPADAVDSGEVPAIVLEVMGFIKETIGINSRIAHSPGKADKKSLSAMMGRLDLIEARLTAASSDDMDSRYRAVLLDTTMMLRHSMKMLIKVVHAYPTGDKQMLDGMRKTLSEDVGELNAQGGLETSLEDMAAAMDELAGFMLEMKHTYAKRADRKLLEKVEARLDEAMAAHRKRFGLD